MRNMRRKWQTEGSVDNVNAEGHRLRQTRGEQDGELEPEEERDGRPLQNGLPRHEASHERVGGAEDEQEEQQAPLAAHGDLVHGGQVLHPVLGEDVQPLEVQQEEEGGSHFGGELGPEHGERQEGVDQDELGPVVDELLNKQRVRLSQHRERREREETNVLFLLANLPEKERTEEAADQDRGANEKVAKHLVRREINPHKRAEKRLYTK